MSGGKSKSNNQLAMLAAQGLIPKISNSGPAISTMTYPDFYPGHKQDIAQQMTAGYGGGPIGAPASSQAYQNSYRANLGLLNQLFEETQLPYVDTKATAKKATAKKKKTTASQAQMAARLPASWRLNAANKTTTTPAQLAAQREREAASWSSSERSRYGSGGNGGLYS